MPQADTGIIKRIIQGFGANTYNQLVVIITQLIGVPILLHYWGAQLYGEWLVLAAIPSYLSMVDLGFSQSAANDMTARVASGDRDGALAIFQSLSALVYGMILICLIVSAFVVSVLPINQWMHFTTIRPIETRWVLWLLAASVLVQLADGVNHAGFRAHGEFAFHSFFYATAILAQMIALWITAILGSGPVVAAFFMLLVRAVNVFALSILLFRRHKALAPGFQHASRKQLRLLFKPALANMAMPLAQAVNVQGMVLVVGSALSPLAVVTFTTLRTLTRFALQLVLSVSHAFEPELAAAWGKNDKILLRQLFLNNLRLGFWLALCAAASLLILGDRIILIWTHGEVSMNSLLFKYLLLSALASVVWYCGLNLLKAANSHLRSSVWYVFSSLVAVFFAALLLKKFNNLSHAGLALLVTDGIMTIYLINTSAKFINSSIKEVLSSMCNLRSLYMDFTALYSRKITGRVSKGFLK